MPRNLREDIDKNGVTFAVRRYLWDTYRWYFLRKQPDWKDEAEYRWLLHSEDVKPEFVSIEDAIQCVIVGMDFPKAKETELIPLCRELRIPAERVTWIDGMPNPNLESIYRP